ncbi:hypothetical protein [Actinoplanes aureus]|uniref:Uncharacterized protein n=1 Tax=Actinoplanes aureus TaxID=2792083 RepID=A0A931C808_9ACTN|nr:hypothetical protein [Actinoplanes aureus]MBG0565115.1 hypothetical protein [Actinoplanes aureus]
MIWQRFSVHRKLVTANRGRWTSWRIPSMRNRRTTLGLTPMVIREPEATWWETQDEASLRSKITVAVIHDQETGGDSDPVVSRLADVAETQHEDLLVMMGTSPPDRDHHAVVTGLRDRLAGHRVVEIRMWPGENGFQEGAFVVERMLATGDLPVVVAPMAALHRIAAEVSSYLHADRVLRVLRTAYGTDLYEVWSRPAEPALN